MPTVTESLIAATYMGHRPCPARSDYLELIIHARGERLNWCIAAGEALDRLEPEPLRLELRPEGRGVQLLARFAGSTDAAPVTGLQAVRWLGESNVRLAIDRRLVALHG